jgi:hypothetical protein
MGCVDVCTTEDPCDHVNHGSHGSHCSNKMCW